MKVSQLAYVPVSSAPVLAATTETAKPKPVDGFDAERVVRAAAATKDGGFDQELAEQIRNLAKVIAKVLPYAATVATFTPGLNAVALPLNIATALKNGIAAVRDRCKLGMVAAVAALVAGGAGAAGVMGFSSLSKLLPDLGKILSSIRALDVGKFTAATLQFLKAGAGTVGAIAANFSDRVVDFIHRLRGDGEQKVPVPKPQG